jgi:hypothetical protein
MQFKPPLFLLVFSIVKFRSHFYSEIRNIVVADNLLAALVTSLGYEKALMKRSTAPSTTPVEFELYRIPQVDESPQEMAPKVQNKKNKKAKKERKPKKDVPSTLLVTEPIAEGLREMREHLENCFTSSGHLELDRLFGDQAVDRLPLKLEICSGFGEWAVKQVPYQSNCLTSHRQWLILEKQIG